LWIGKLALIVCEDTESTFREVDGSGISFSVSKAYEYEHY